MKNEAEKLFESCRSNLDTPITGRIYDPLCRTCRNLVHPEDPFLPLRCRIFGKLPKEIYLADQAPCESYTAKD